MSKPDFHDVAGLFGGKNTMVTTAGVIGMRVGDQCPLNGNMRIDVKAAGRAIKAEAGWVEYLFRLHSTGPDLETGCSGSAAAA